MKQLLLFASFWGASEDIKRQISNKSKLGALTMKIKMHQIKRRHFRNLVLSPRKNTRFLGFADI